MKSLPSQFDSFKSNYNTLKVEWFLDEMTTILVKEEDDINNNKTISISLVNNQKGIVERV